MTLADFETKKSSLVNNLRAYDDTLTLEDAEKLVEEQMAAAGVNAANLVKRSNTAKAYAKKG